MATDDVVGASGPLLAPLSCYHEIAKHLYSRAPRHAAEGLPFAVVTRERRSNSLASRNSESPILPVLNFFLCHSVPTSRQEKGCMYCCNHPGAGTSSHNMGGRWLQSRIPHETLPRQRMKQIFSGIVLALLAVLLSQMKHAFQARGPATRDAGTDCCSWTDERVTYCCTYGCS